MKKLLFILTVATLTTSCIKEYNGSGSGSGSGSGTDEYGSSCDGINGKWMSISSCTNTSNESNWFSFTASETSCNEGSGRSFSSDCNSTCTGLGVNFYYTWTSTNSTIDITWTSVGDYCGIESDTPSPETLNYTLSGDVLNINGHNYQRQ